MPETLPLVRIDGPLLERAVANVVANALAVQPEDQPVRVEAGGGGPRRCTCGWWTAARASRRRTGTRVFAPFQRLGDRSTQAGVGLGLAIARGFTRAMGGDLDLDDTPGGGLTVVFRLPVATGAGWRR